MTVSDAQLQAIIAALKPQQTAQVDRPVCSVCGERLDPTLVEAGRHLLCEPAPVDLRAEIMRVVQTADAEAPRSRQTAIGPSEVGHPCDRYLAYKLFAATPVNVRHDNWLAILGTATHAWLADAFQADNTRLGRTRWTVEHRVYATDGLSGSCDLYDHDTATVIDHKILGVTSLRKIRSGDIPPKYRTQLHIYGYGHTRAGRPVQTVALACYPRADTLRGEYSGNGLHLHTEPYDPAIALAALERIAKVTQDGAVLELDTHPDRYQLIPATPEDCRYCPYYKPGAASASDAGCPGQTTTELPTSIPGLLA